MGGSEIFYSNWQGTEFDTYRAAKASMNEILNGGKLPKIEALKKERRELVTVKGNIDHLLSVTEDRDDKEQTC